jgi:predicted ester cyclase
MPDNTDIITRFELGFRAGDQTTIDELSDPGLVDHNPQPDHAPTLAGFKEKIAYMCSCFPDLKEDLQDIAGNGDTVATRWVLTGSQQQDFMGIPASGQKIRVEGMNFLPPQGRSRDRHLDPVRRPRHDAATRRDPRLSLGAPDGPHLRGEHAH